MRNCQPGVGVSRASSARTSSSSSQSPVPRRSNSYVYEPDGGVFSDQAHSSAERAGLLAGVRMRQLPTDANFSLRGDVLARAIQKDKAKGLIPFFVSTYTFSHLLSAKARQLFGGEFGNSSFTKTHRQSAYQSVVSAKEIEQNFGTEQNRSTLVHALIEKMTPILGVLKLVKNRIFSGVTLTPYSGVQKAISPKNWHHMRT